LDLSYHVRRLAESFYALEQGVVRCFLLVGAERALLVDTGFGGDLRAVVAGLTDKPVTLVSTHSDGDHTGGDADFPAHYIHAAELARYVAHRPEAAPPVPVEEGYVFDLAPYRLEVVHLPGHTPGSIALLERERRFLIGGDVVSTRPIFLFGDGREPAAYRGCLEKLMGLAGAFDRIYPAHGELPLPPERVGRTLAALDEILAGRGEICEAEKPRFPAEVKLCRAGDCAFLMTGF